MESQNYSEPLVGTIAIALAVGSIAVSLGPWSSPYQLRSVAAVRRRFGKPAARLMWMLVAVASFASGLAIFTGVRPPYAEPESHAGPEPALELVE